MLTNHKSSLPKRIKRNAIIVGLCLISIWLSNCGGSSGSFMQNNTSVQTTPSGVKYLFHLQNKNARRLKTGDFITFQQVVQNHVDTVLSHQTFKESPFNDKYYIGKEYFKDIFSMLAEGDSITFWIHSDSLLHKRGFLKSPKIKEGTEIKYTIKVLKITNQAEIRKKLDENLKVQREIDEQKIEEYITQVREKDSTLRFQATNSGLRYFFFKEGAGKQPTKGDTIVINYNCTRLDGTVYYDSDEEGSVEYLLGNSLVDGLDEGISLMKEGTKGTFIVPSELGFGNKKMGTLLPPNSVLIFNVELLKVK
jgi:FKBP-type peptidyl-prolyl cis-trans isomerase FkpA